MFAGITLGGILIGAFLVISRIYGFRKVQQDFATNPVGAADYDEPIKTTVPPPPPPDPTK